MKPCGLTYVGWNLLRKKRARVISKNPPTTDYSSVGRPNLRNCRPVADRMLELVKFGPNSVIQ